LIALGFSGAWIGNLTVLEPYRPILSARRWWRCSLPGGVSTVQREPANRGTCAQFPSARYLQAHVLDRGRAGSGRARIPLCHAIFLLTTGVHHEKLFASLAIAAVVAPVWAATQTVTLSVPGMTCSACPITVKKAISKVEGVSKVDVTFETREAVVTFDDAKTSVQKLTKATEDAGYPSSVKK
jgi:mercuric ion binding protein